MMRPLPIGVDTNILARFVVKADLQHALVYNTVQLLITTQVPLFTTFQNVAECWNALTRPADNRGFGLTPQEADREVRNIESLFQIITESQAAYKLWRRTVAEQSVSGVQVHDARIACVLTSHGVNHLLTLNGKDFARFGITVITPDDIVAQAVQNTGNNP